VEKPSVASWESMYMKLTPQIMCSQFVSIREYFQGRRAKPRGDARFISLLEGLLTYLDLGFSRGARSRLCSTNKRFAQPRHHRGHPLIAMKSTIAQTLRSRT
jgi:hypothetical protein